MANVLLTGPSGKKHVQGVETDLVLFWRIWGFRDGFLGFVPSTALSTWWSPFLHPLSWPLDLGVKIAEGSVPFREGLLGHDFDADLLQMRQEFGPFRPGSKVKAPWPVREVNQWTPHGFGEQSGQVVDSRRLPTVRWARTLSWDWLMTIPHHTLSCSESEHGMGKKSASQVSSSCC